MSQHTILFTVLQMIASHDDGCSSEGADPRSLNFGTRWRLVVSFTLRPP